MPSTALIPLLSERTRAVIYAIYAVGSTALGATQVAYAAAELGQPTWLVVALAVWAFLGGAVGYTAVTHVPAAPRRALTEPAEDWRVEDDQPPA